MSGKGGVIKEFLVGLGYKIDGDSERKFKESIRGATDLFSGLKATIGAIAVGGSAYAFFRWLDGASSGLENLYFQAKRAGTSVNDLKAFGYAASQMGSSAEQAIQSAQNMYQWILNNPNAETLLRSRFGIQTRDKDGNLLGGPELSGAVGSALAGQPAYRQKQYADLMGIPLELRQALLQAAEFTKFQQHALELTRAAGLDPAKTAENAHEFQNQLRDLGYAMGIARDSVVNALVGDKSMGGAIDRFKMMLLTHLPQIDRIVSKFADSGIKGFGRILDYLSTVDWDKVFNRIEQFVKYLLPAESSDGTPKIDKPAGFNDWFWQHIFDYVGGMWDPGARARVHHATGAGWDWRNHSGDFHPERTHYNTLGFRSNNPGNLVYNAYTRGLGAIGQNSSGFAVFPDLKTGLNAIVANLANYGHKGVNTPSTIAHRWSKTDQAAYTKNLAALFGGDPNKLLDMTDPKTLQMLMDGIIRQENGSNPYREHRPRGSSKDRKAGGDVHINAPTHITVHAAPDPHGTASAVAHEQHGVNQRLVRNARVVVA